MLESVVYPSVVIKIKCVRETEAYMAWFLFREREKKEGEEEIGDENPLMKIVHKI